MILSSALLSLALMATPTGDTCSSSAAAVSVGSKDIVDTAVAAGSFNTLAAALKAGDLVDALKGKGPLTVFAPTDEAFAKLPKGQLAQLLDPKNKGLLQAILTYHVVPGSIDAAQVVKTNGLASLNGQRINFITNDKGVTVNGAKVLKTDIECSNGLIHVIDTVIIPSSLDIVETAVSARSFKTLAAALDAAKLIEALKGDGPFTVFAPTDEAFAKLPKGAVANLLKPENADQLRAVLKFHVISGRVYSDAAAKGAAVATLQGTKIKTMSKDGSVFVNGAKVVKADIETTNGVIHVIDSVLLPE